MPRPPLMAHPVRLHISLEEETVKKLRRLAKQKSKNVTEMIRGLAKAYADGTITLREEPLFRCCGVDPCFPRASSSITLNGQRKTSFAR